MLDSQTIKKIEDFVYSQPRSIQEIALHIGKSWRTADRYTREIEKEFGTITTKTFRGGTRGALKIVYWSSVEKVSSSIFQEKLEEEIMRLKKKEDFSAFEIYQHVSSDKKKATIEKKEKEDETNLKELKDYMEKATKQILIFSGNLSWVNLENKKISFFGELDKLVKRNISIKILSRVDLAGLENIRKALSLNFKHGKEIVEIRHCEQPLRAIIIDKKIARLKEIKEPTGKINELNKRLYIFYTIKDKEWIDWLSRIFWKLFSNSIDANKRIEELRKLN